MFLKISKSERITCLLFTLLIGMVLFVWSLGSTGLVDETPPLFAAAGRGMSATGDWLTPRVNGLPRFDKPPLVYWFMGLFYSLPWHEIWDPLGTWAARLPSAIASICLMLLLTDTLLCYQQKDCLYPRRTAITTTLAFALSPLVIIWSRIAVSDALLCGTLGISMLLQWRRYANPRSESWWMPWFVLGLAVLTKGPVALVLMGLTFLFFGLHQRNFYEICLKLKPLRGLFLTSIICIPWYLIEFWIEGKPFWDSFFGYHNFQRFTTVVNSHLQPWWFFGLILIIASLPFTPFLFQGLYQGLFLSYRKIGFRAINPENSLATFAACWLISVLFLFTSAATKLPSYWLPATPAAAILIGLSSSYCGNKYNKFSFISFIGSIAILIALSSIFWSSLSWIVSIRDPEIPNLGPELLSSYILHRGAICLIIITIIAILNSFNYKPGRLVILQFPFMLFYSIVIFPVWELADRIRQLPLRKVSELIVKDLRKNEAVAMVGAVKPSVHFYTKKIVLYEGRSAGALVNLSERLRYEKRKGWQGNPISGSNSSRTVLLVIDKSTAKRSHWKGLKQDELGQFGIYKVWRLDRLKLERRAKGIINQGIKPDWKFPWPEKF